MGATRISMIVDAPRARVYRALIDAHAVATWMVPDGMTSQVHAFDAREGGGFRISLTYDAPNATGKTSADTDTFHGRFVTLVPDEQVVEVIEFETADPALRGEMTVSFTLIDADGGTRHRRRRRARSAAARPVGGRQRDRLADVARQAGGAGRTQRLATRRRCRRRRPRR